MAAQIENAGEAGLSQNAFRDISTPTRPTTYDHVLVSIRLYLAKPSSDLSVRDIQGSYYVACRVLVAPTDIQHQDVRIRVHQLLEILR
jgi:hypothetical protein